jgi:hypothetical protein
MSITRTLSFFFVGLLLLVVVVVGGSLVREVDAALSDLVQRTPTIAFSPVARKSGRRKFQRAPTRRKSLEQHFAGCYIEQRSANKATAQSSSSSALLAKTETVLSRLIFNSDICTRRRACDLGLSRWVKAGTVFVSILCQNWLQKTLNLRS